MVRIEIYTCKSIGHAHGEFKTLLEQLDLEMGLENKHNTQRNTHVIL